MEKNDEYGTMEEMDEEFSEAINEITQEEIPVTNDNLIKCGNDTDPNKLAYYMIKKFEDGARFIEVQTIGPKALSKAALAIIRMKSLIAPYTDGSTLVARYSIRKLKFGEEERTAIRQRVFVVPDTFSV